TGRTGRALVNDATDARGEGGVPYPVQDNLSDGALAVVVLAARLIVDRARETLERLLARSFVALELERRRSRIGPAGERDSLVDLERLIGGELPDEKWRRSRRRSLGSLGAR